MTCRCEKTEVECLSALPIELCLRVVKDADSGPFQFIIKDEDGVPIDITNDTIRLRVFDELGGVVKLTKANTPGQHWDAFNGKTRFTIARTDISDTLGDEVTDWVYEVRRIQTDNTETVHYQGDFEIRLSVAGG